MDLEIQTDGGIFLISVAAAATIKDLKNQIRTEREIYSGNDVYYMGYLCEDHELVSDFLDVGNKTFAFLKTQTGDVKSTPKRNSSFSMRDMTPRLISGEPQKPKLLNIFPERNLKFKNKFKKFGLMNPTSHVIDVYGPSESGSIELRSKGEEVRVFLIPDDQPEKEIIGVRKSYDVSEIFPSAEKMSKMDQIVRMDEEIKKMVWGDTINSSSHNKESYKKVFECPIMVDFPNNETDKIAMKERVKEIVYNATKSAIDLKFVKDKILEEYTDEIVSLDFEDLDLAKLPWDSMIFDVVDIRRGSTILKFNLEFKKRPTNQDEQNTYRLIELVVVTVIENLHFIKDVKNKKGWENDGENMVLSANIKAHTFDEDLFKATLKSLRGSLNLIAGKKAEGVVGPSEKEIENYLQNLLQDKSDKVKKLLNLELTPLSMRKVMNIIKDSRITDPDFAKITFEVENSGKKKKNRCEVVELSKSSWLFPYDFRRLSDLGPEKFDDLLIFTKILPREKQFWNESFLVHLDIYKTSNELIDQRIKLAKEVDVLWPYQEILNDYKKQGGTLGGLLKALEMFKKEVAVEDAKNRISQFVTEIENIRTEMYEQILENMFCPSPIPAVRNIEEFEKMCNEKNLKLKTTPMQKFMKLKKHLQPGDQLWIFHQRPLMRSYAHVVIVIDDQQFIHANSPNLKLMIQARAIIKKDFLIKQFKDDQFCFVVHQSPPSARESDIFRKRAISCEGIRFDYDPETSNCETFCNGVHGKWEENVNGKELRGLTQRTVDTVAKTFHFVQPTNENLTKQMLKKFEEENLRLLTDPSDGSD